MRTIYILGHNGFIGKSLMGLLSNEKVVFFTREDFKRISSNEKIIDFMPKDVFIDLAWEHLDNFQSSLHLIETLPAHIGFYNSLLKMGIKNVTSLGTCVEYGTREGELNEDMASDQILPYAIAKNSLRSYLEFQKTKTDFSFNWIRLFFLYGDGQPKRTIYSQLIEAIENKNDFFNMSLGMQKRDYLHVAEAAKIISQVALSGKNCGIVNCCSGKPISMLDFVKTRMEELGGNLVLNLGKYPYPIYEGLAFWGSRKKLNTILKNEFNFP